MLKGLNKTDEGALVKEFAEAPGVKTDYAAQTILQEVVTENGMLILGLVITPECDNVPIHSS